MKQGGHLFQHDWCPYKNAGERWWEAQGIRRVATLQRTSLASSKNKHVFSHLMMTSMMMIKMMIFYHHLLSFYQASYSSIRHGLI